MKTKNTLMTAAAMLATAGLYAAQLDIDTVRVGNAGNAADTSANGGTQGAGAVSYEYNIGTTAVTSGQYAAFLNAVATDATGAAPAYIASLYNTNMATATYACGIIRTDNLDGTYSYTVKAGSENLPVNYVNMYDAMRFCNWVTTGNTEFGVYTLNGAANAIALVVRNDAAWQAGGVAIASLDEWYKATFYNGTTETYSKFANGKDTITTAEANFDRSVGNLTDVFAYGTTSFYGALDMIGNVWERTDTVTGSSTYRRGGDFASPESNVASSYNYTATVTNEDFTIGFRVSSLNPIPEPSTYAAIFGALALAIVAYRRRK